ncbi:hypothetical protein BG57_00300 [Caballeronia grimmiae]|uniref:Uncharacterized protein n=1 Tax=Caballeronia grimmiae TaxID=1071679 RepID=A0A069P8X3_9BURK|nr:hypothetical protein BG57_00300 [Caballeronia grimmiae]
MEREEKGNEARNATRNTMHCEGFSLTRGMTGNARRAAAWRFHRLKSECYTPTHSNKRSARSAHALHAMFHTWSRVANAGLSLPLVAVSVLVD